ncbi:MAG: EFR1 family ferrodoxin, partial [Candidatus Coproplasma sp.]
MCDNEGVFRAMNAVVFYSATGESKAVADYFSKRLNYTLLDIREARHEPYKNLVLVFPVHCQNVPTAVNNFLKSARIENLTAIATYGRMCCGNVLQEIQEKYGLNIVAGAYIPTAHSYKCGESFDDWKSLTPVIEKVNRPSPIKLPRLYKNPFASLLPDLRSRINVKIYRTADCTDCGVCTDNCPYGAIANGVTNNRCIRCLKCVNTCPNHALKFKLRLPLR